MSLPETSPVRHCHQGTSEPASSEPQAFPSRPLPEVTIFDVQKGLICGKLLAALPTLIAFSIHSNFRRTGFNGSIPNPLWKTRTNDEAKHECCAPE